VSWTADDPGQGDPTIIAALAGDLQSQADTAADAGRQLHALHHNTTDTIWHGHAGDTFRNRIATLPAHLEQSHGSYSTTPLALFVKFVGSKPHLAVVADGSDCESGHADCS